MQIKILKSNKAYAVFDELGKLRVFDNKQEADRFIADQDDMYVKYIPRQYDMLTVEEAPF